MVKKNMTSDAELNGVAYMNNNRNLQAELLGTHSQKHIVCVQTPRHDCSPSDSCTKKVKTGIYARRGQSDPKPARDHSYGFCTKFSFASPHDETKTSIMHPKTRTPVQPSTASASCSSASPKIDPYSFAKSLAKSGCSKSEPLAIYEGLRHRQHACGLPPSEIYEDDSPEFERPTDYGCSECQKDNMDHCTNDKELEDLLYSNEAARGNFVLSSGRWSVNQGNALPGTSQLTIDKEFEQHFAMLM